MFRGQRYRCAYLTSEAIERFGTTDAVERHDREWKPFVTSDLVMHFMNKLADSDRRILELAYFRGLTQREIAKELRVSPATVCRLVQHAKSQLKRLIDP